MCPTRLPNEGAWHTVLTIQVSECHASEWSKLSPGAGSLWQSAVLCQKLGLVGRSDHYAILVMYGSIQRRKKQSHALFGCGRRWLASHETSIEPMNWEVLLVGDAENRARAPTTKLLGLQSQFVSHWSYFTKPTDVPWFGLARCCQMQAFCITEEQATPVSPKQSLASWGLQTNDSHQQVIRK